MTSRLRLVLNVILHEFASMQLLQLLELQDSIPITESDVLISL